MFAPTWERLVKSKSHLERLGGFHMAQVNCIAQGGELSPQTQLALRTSADPQTCATTIKLKPVSNTATILDDGQS